MYLLSECVPMTGTSIMYLSSFLKSQDMQNHLYEAVSMATELSGLFLVI